MFKDFSSLFPEDFRPLSFAPPHFFDKVFYIKRCITAFAIHGLSWLTAL
jgi:hypothetical protein